MRLLACPDCRRRYNAEGLAPGERVRCRCGSELDAATALEKNVEALVCSNCGAPATLEGDTCTHCSARLVRRSTLICPDCTTRLDDDSQHCKKCGVELCTQELHPLPPDAACPRCKGDLQLRLLDHADLTECKDCGGIWLEPQGFESVCDRAEEHPVVTFGPEKSIPEQPEESLRAYIDCPRCARGLLRRQFRYGDRPSGVVLDYCREHGVWLDHRELERVVAFVREKGTGLDRQSGNLALGSKRKAPDAQPASSKSGGSGSAAAFGAGVGEVLIEALAMLVSGIFH